MRGLAFINPGNPTGQCLTEANLQDLIKFAVDNEIVLMADEVYQPNIYQDEKPFVSARYFTKCQCTLHERASEQLMQPETAAIPQAQLVSAAGLGTLQHFLGLSLIHI